MLTTFVRRAIINSAIAAAIGLTCPSCLAADGSVTLNVIDRLGRSKPVVTILLDADGKEIARSLAPGEPARVAPGRWAAAAAGDLDRSRWVEITDGAAVTVDMHAPDAVWLRLFRGDNLPPYNLLLRQKSPSDLADLLPRLRFLPSRDAPFAMPRPDASAEARAMALRIARDELAKPPPAAGATDERARNAARIWAQRILAAIGEASDVPEMTIAARIENRLGVLTHGLVAAALAQGGDPAISAALLLHSAGYDDADAVILDAAADAAHPLVFGTLLSFSAETVRPAMVAAAQHYAARYQEIAAAAHDTYNENEPAALPAILYLMAYGPDDVLAALLDHFDADLEDAQILAVAAADPAQFADYIIALSGLDDAKSTEAMDAAAVQELPVSLARLCGAAQALRPTEQAALWSRLYQLMYDRVASRHTLYYSSSDSASDAHYPTFASGRFLALAGECTTSRWVAAQYLARDSGNWSGWIPLVDWIPHYWQDQDIIDVATTNASRLAGTSDLIDQLDLMPDDRFEKLLDAKGDASRAYPLDLYRALHRVASHANGAFARSTIHVATDAERRPYVMGQPQQPGTYDGAVSGIAELRPELVDGRLRLHLSLQQVTAYTAHFQMFGKDDLGGKYNPSDGGQRYILDRGRALVAAVRLWRDNQEIPLAAPASDDFGAQLYEADVGDTGVDRLIAEVDLNYFGDRRQLVYTLYDGDYAVRVRRAASAASRATTTLRDKPDAAETLLALARAQWDSGRIAAAEATYHRLTMAQPQVPDLWVEAANAYTGVEDHAAAAEILRAGAAANPGNATLVAELANAQFLAGQYAEAAARYADLAKLTPDDPLPRTWQGVNLLLAGDLSGADQVLASLPPGFQARLVAQLRLLIGELGSEKGKQAARDRYATFAAGEAGKADEYLVGLLIGKSDPDTVLSPVINLPSTSPVARCDAELWVGEWLAFSSKFNDARPHLEAALANCRRPQIQYHLARQAVARLPTP